MASRRLVWVDLQKPEGFRSCRDVHGRPGRGGSWHYAGDPTFVLTDLRELKTCVTHIELVMLTREFKAKLDRATRGELYLERGEHRQEVVQCQRQQRVLEVRLDDRQERPPGSGRWKVRFYYSEPEHEPEVLLALSVQVKVAGRPGLNDQNRHIDEAAQRLDEHYR